MLSLIAAFALTAQPMTLPNSPPSPAPSPTQGDHGSRTLNGSINGLFSANDYPQEALARGEQGTVGIRLQVDRTGVVSGCDITEPSGSQTLDAATCSIATARARFEPARDAQGQAVASTYHQNIIWRIAKTKQPSTPWSQRVIVALGSDGKPVTCRLELHAPGAAQKTNPPCDAAKLFGGAQDLPPLPKGAVSLIIEESFNPGPATPLSLAADEVLISRQVRSVDIDATGTVTACQLLEEQGQPSSLAPCADAFLNYFAPRKGANGKPAAFSATRTLSAYARLPVGTAGAEPAP